MLAVSHVHETVAFLAQRSKLIERNQNNILVEISVCSARISVSASRNRNISVTPDIDAKTSISVTSNYGISLAYVSNNMIFVTFSSSIFAPVSNSGISVELSPPHSTYSRCPICRTTTALRMAEHENTWAFRAESIATRAQRDIRAHISGHPAHGRLLKLP
jgi:hypothetical protein